MDELVLQIHFSIIALTMDKHLLKVKLLEMDNSSLAVLHDGSIGVLFEDKSWGGPIKFMRVNFEWLTKGKNNPKKNGN